MLKRACALIGLGLLGVCHAAAVERLVEIGVIDSDRMAANIINQITLSRDGRRLLLQGPVNDVQVATVFDVPTGKPIFEAKKISRAALSPDGRHLAYVDFKTYSVPERLHLRSLDKQADVYTYDQRPSIMDIFFDGTGDRLLHSMPAEPTGSANYGRLRAVSVRDGSLVWTIAVPSQYGNMMMETGTGDRFAMQTDKQPWTIYDAATGKPVSNLQLPPRETANVFNWGGDGQHALVVTEKKQAIIYDTKTGVGQPSGEVAFPGHLYSPDLQWMIDSRNSELTAFNRTDPTRCLTYRVGPRWGSVVRYDPASGIAYAIEDGSYGGRIIVSKLPPISAWSPEVSASPATRSTPTPAQWTDAKPLVLPTTQPADATWWTTQATADFADVVDLTVRARIAWKLSAVQSLYGDTALARHLLEDANRAGVAPAVIADWQFNDQLRATYELARRLARTDVAAARAVLDGLDDQQRFIADLMPEQAIAVGCVEGERYDEAVRVLQGMHGAAKDTVAGECATALSGRQKYETAGRFINQIRPGMQRARTCSAVVLAAIKDDRIDFAISRWPELANLSNSVTSVIDVRRQVLEALATAAEAASRADVLKMLSDHDPTGAYGLTRGRAIAMARRRDWDGLDGLIKPLKPLERRGLLRELAPEIATTGSDAALQRFERTDKGAIDWDSVIYGLTATNQLDLAIKHLDEPGPTESEREQMRQRVSNVLRQAGRVEEAEHYTPAQPGRRDDPATKAALAWKRQDRAAYEAALSEFDRLYSRALANQPDRLSAMRASVMRRAGDLAGAWETLDKVPAVQPEQDFRDRGKAYIDFYLDARRAGDEKIAAKAAVAIEQPAMPAFSDPITELVYRIGQRPNPIAEVAHLYGLLRTPAGRVRLCVVCAGQSLGWRTTPPQ